MRRPRIHPQRCLCRACTGIQLTGLGPARPDPVAHAIATLTGALICAAVFALLAL